MMIQYSYWKNILHHIFQFKCSFIMPQIQKIYAIMFPEASGLSHDAELINKKLTVYELQIEIVAQLDSKRKL